MCVLLRTLGSLGALPPVPRASGKVGGGNGGEEKVQLEGAHLCILDCSIQWVWQRACLLPLLHMPRLRPFIPWASVSASVKREA